MSEEMLIRNCAPTLAGIKTANLFSCPYDSERGLYSELRTYNALLHENGVSLLPMKVGKDRALVYVYRPKLLRRDMEDEDRVSLLRSMGYERSEPMYALTRRVKLCRGDEYFPHEIGLFLGYPSKDVLGFIEHKAKGYIYAGYWKVYDDVECTKRLFARYKSCTESYCRRHRDGVDIKELSAKR